MGNLCCLLMDYQTEQSFLRDLQNRSLFYCQGGILMMSIEMIFFISAVITIPLCLLEIVLWYGICYFLVNHPRFKKFRKFFVKLTFGCHAWHRRRICVASGFGCPKDLQCSPGTTFCKTSCPYFNKPNLLEADMQRITHSTAQTNRETMRNPCE